MESLASTGRLARIFSDAGVLQAMLDFEAALARAGARVDAIPASAAAAIAEAARAEGFDIAEQGTKEVPPELLEEVFELNMALDEIESGDSDAANQVVAARNRFETVRSEIDADLMESFAQWDGGGGAKSLQEIRSLLNRRKYITNLINRANQATEHVSD